MNTHTLTQAQDTVTNILYICVYSSFSYFFGWWVWPSYTHATYTNLLISTLHPSINTFFKTDGSKSGLHLSQKWDHCQYVTLNLKTCISCLCRHVLVINCRRRTISYTKSVSQLACLPPHSFSFLTPCWRGASRFENLCVIAFSLLTDENLSNPGSTQLIPL